MPAAVSRSSSARSSRADANRQPRVLLQVAAAPSKGRCYPSGILRSASHSLRRVGHLCASRPHVWVIPLILTGLMVGLGIWATVTGAHKDMEFAKDRASAITKAACNSVELSIQQVYTPALQLADWVNNTLDYRTLTSQFQNRVAPWWPMTKGAAIFMAMGPFGRIAAQYPPNATSSGQTEPFNYLNFASVREQVLDSIKTGNITIADPILSDLGYLMTIQLPIMVSNVSENETWGIPWPTVGCPPRLCYRPQTRTRWWGNTAITINASSFFSDTGPLSNLKSAGYQWQVWRPPNRRLNETEWVSVNPDGVRKHQPEDALRGTFNVVNTEWEVHVWQVSWLPEWEVPAIIAISLVSPMIGLMIFAILLSWEEHRVLLHKLLPKAAIDQMRSQINWAHLDDDTSEVKLFDIQTPAQQMIAIIQAVMANETPPMAWMVNVKQALQRSADVYRPAYQDLHTELKAAAGLDDETRRALVQQLAGSVDSQQELDRVTRGFGHGSDSDDSEAPRTSRAELPDLEPTEDLQGMLVYLMAEAKTPSAAPASIAGSNAGSLPAVWDRPTDSNDSGVHTPTSKTTNRKSYCLTPSKPIIEELERVLATSDTWEFDAFALEEASAGRPLSTLGYWLIHKSGCLSFARMPPGKLAVFLRKIEAGYPRHPYHNNRHAADVLQSFHMLLVHGGLRPHYWDDMTLLACYLAAIIHDYDHRGVSNDYLVNTKHKLAIRYNDRSPMENHHLAAAWSLLQHSNTACLENLPRPTQDKLRKTVIDLVLATDMKQHMVIMGQFNTLTATASPTEENTSGPGPNSGRVLERSASNAGDAPPAAPPSTESEKLLCLQVALKCADLGNLSAPLPVYLRWLNNLEDEYFLQGDSERSLGLPISPLCDRTKEGVTKCQTGFCEFVVFPLFTAFCQRFPASRPILKAAVSNYHYWKQSQSKDGTQVRVSEASSNSK